MNPILAIYLWGFLGVAFQLISKWMPLGNHSKRWTATRKKVAIYGAILSVIGYTIVFVGVQEGVIKFLGVDLELGKFVACLLGIGSSSILQHWVAKLIKEN